MITINMQYFGGNGASSGKSGGGGAGVSYTTSDRTVEVMKPQVFIGKEGETSEKGYMM